MGCRRWPYIVKDQVHIMARKAQIGKEKPQSIVTLRHESQSIQKISRTFKVSSSAVEKSIKSYDETGSHEYRHKKGRP
jgi:transposase